VYKEGILAYAEPLFSASLDERHLGNSIGSGASAKCFRVLLEQYSLAELSVLI
jgi:hypothetical protein